MNQAGFQKLLTAERHSEFAAFWRERFALLSEDFILRQSWGSSPIHSENCCVEVGLAPEAEQAVSRIAKGKPVGILVVALAGLAYLLSRHANQSVVRIDSSPLNPQSQASPVPLIVDLEGCRDLQQLLEKVRSLAVASFNLQDFPVEEAVRHLLKRGRLPGSNVALLSEEVQGESATDGDHDLVVSIPAGMPLRLRLRGRNGSFGEDFLRALGRQLVVALSRFDNLQAPLPSVSLLDPEQLAALRRAEKIPFPDGKTIDRLFQEQAEKTPQNIALRCQGREMTYRQLDQATDNLACSLQNEYGVQRGDVVGVLADRSDWLVLGLLGAMKAGGVYLPIDPENPKQRIGFVLRDAAVKVLLVHSNYFPLLTDFYETPMFALDFQAAGLADGRPAAEGRAASDAAYLIYTSGSTGTPKGVLLGHRGFVNMISDQIRGFGIEADDRVILLASPGFDASLSEVFMALLAGASLLMAPKEVISDPRLFCHFMDEQQVSVATFPPAYLASLGRRKMGSLRVIISAGDHARVNDALHYSRQVRFFNAYGPTEASVCTTYYRVDPNQRYPSRVPIGKPVANASAVLCDDALQPLPAGIAGEICIGGTGLALGYWQQGSLSRDGFADNPFGQGALYRSGDVGVQLPDGNLEFIGRRDSQVKLRGYRIELGEIESLLNQHRAVKQAAAVAREEQPGDLRLVAYVVWEEDQAGLDDLRRHLQERLPEYMIPSAFVVLEEFPLSPAGKIDRKALPDPSLAGRQVETEYVGPGNPREEIVANIWSEILAVERPGVQDNFFELGGHSLTATQIASRIREAFSVDVPLGEFFASPTISGLSALIEKAGGAEAEKAAPAIQPAPRTDDLPLSFAQQRLWFLDQFEGGSPTYNIPLALRIEGRLEVDLCERSINGVIERHEALRTTFRNLEGSPRQVISPAESLSIERQDLSGVPSARIDEEVLAQAVEEARRPFSLDQWPLLRMRWLRLAPERHVLLLTLHHIISDGWSLGILVEELAAFYRAFHAGTAPKLEPLPIQYADFACWQRQWLQGQELQRQLCYWKEQLAGSPTLLELPADRPRPPAETFDGATESALLSAHWTSGLERLSRSSNVTLFMTLLAGFSTLLGRVSRCHDVLVGSPIANRHLREVEPLIGFFVNTLVLRNSLRGNPSFDELLSQVRETTLAGYAHQDLPFEKLVQELQPERNLSHSPIFQVVLSLQKGSIPQLQLPDVEAAPLDLGTAPVRFDLLFDFKEAEGGLMLAVEYNRDLFDRQTVRRLIGQFERLLESAAAQPEQKIADLPLTSRAQRHQLSAEWGRGHQSPHPELCVHQIIEGIAQSREEAIAASFGDFQLSYSELNGRANRLARHLRRLGLGNEARAAVLMERSLEMVVGMLAVWKASAAYVPLDPAYPAQRRRFMMEDAGIALALTEQMLLEEQESISAMEHENLASRAVPGNLAYVIYTSGTTGRAKGVSVTHAALANFLRSMQREPGLSADEVLLAVTPVSFDISALEIFLPLAVGARTVIADRNTARDARLLRTELEESGATVMQATPSTWRMLCQGGWPSTPLRALCGGEALPRDLAEELARRSSQAWNLYGPTETTIWSAAGAVRSAQGPVALGRPILNTQIFILDGQLRPVPPGVAGELCIGGRGLARGYLNRPALTAQAFLPDPFSEGGGWRIYRTGDLARFRADGAIEFLGRLDHQVKLHGFRIELEEIEAALAQHPAIGQAVVAALGEGASRRLVAYLVRGEGKGGGENRRERGEGKERGAEKTSRRTPRSFSASSAVSPPLPSFLSRRLPEYMLPTQYCFIDSFPLTPSGKIDRKALPSPDSSRPDLGSYVEARTPVERALAKIWSELLEIERVGVQDSFFDLGGHSMLATQAVARIRQAFSVEVPVRTLFERPTIALLAQHIEEVDRDSGLLPEIKPRRRQGPQPLSYAQQRLWFLQQMEGSSPTYNIPAAVRIKGELDLEAVERTLQFLVRRHETLRTTFALQDGSPVQIIHDSMQVGLEVIEIGELALLDDLLAQQARQPFDLSRGPLLRTRLFKLGSQQHVLALTMHHIVSDGWSMKVLVGEFAQAFSRLAQGLPVELPDLAVQYADYAVWQREWLQSEALEQQIDYWKGRLEGLPEKLDLPSDRPRPPVQSFRGAVLGFELDPALSQRLRQLSRQSQASLFMTLLAAFQLLLSRCSGQDDIAVGVPVANRRRLEVEPLIGLFVNTLVLRTDLSGRPTFAEVLQRVKQATLDAQAHQDLPFEKLVEEINPPRRLGHHPLFQVMFDWQEGLDAPDIAGLQFEPCSVYPGAAKFDMTWFMEEKEGAISGLVEYCTALFDAATIRRMIAHYQMVLEAATRHPERPAWQIELLDDSEKALLQMVNSTAERLPELCGHQLFERQAIDVPDAVAVCWREERLSYSQLDAMADQIACGLSSLAAGPEALVGICMQRSPLMLAALLGVWKAGAAFVPLDPDYPRQRIEFLLADSRTSLTLTQPELLDQLPVNHAAALRFNSGGGQRSGLPKAAPSNLAYVLYTSGSTGTPKGCAITHRNLVNYLSWAGRRYLGDAASHFAWFTSISFDLTLTSILCPLTSGKTVIAFDPGEPLHSNLRRCFDPRTAVDIVKLTPSHIQIIDELELGSSNVLRTVVGGEALSLQGVQRLHGLRPEMEVINEYGPTEATIGCIAKAVGDADRLVSIGRPIANAEAFILDAEGSLAAIGIPAEICLAGAGLGRGYFGRPRETAQAFVPHPWRDGERLYRTGDRGRWLPEGEIEFLGRIDRQFKIRGFRLEPGEIEVQLSSHPQVREARVEMISGQRGEAVLVAYYRPADSASPSTEELKEHLQSRLHSAAVPSYFIAVGQWPLSAHGKLDSRALPQPAFRGDQRQSRYVAPRTPVEEVVAGIFSDLLGIEQMGIFDDFFALGGHSLLAIRALARIEEAFSVELPVRDFFEAPHVAGLCSRIEEPRRGAVAPPIRPSGQEPPHPLSFAQQRLWFLDQLEGPNSTYNVPLALRLEGPFDRQLLQRSLRIVAQRHDSLRSVFALDDGLPRQRLLEADRLTVEFESLRQQPMERREEEARQIVNRLAQRPFDLAEGPLLRVHCLQLAEDSHVLLFNLHHIISDAWSMEVFARELLGCYQALASGEGVELPELPVQYSDYARWQRQWLDGEVLEAELKWWKDRLKGIPALLELPTDRPRPAIQTSKGATVEFRLERDRLAALKALASESRSSLFMTLLAAFAALMSRYSNQRDIVLGTPIANRKRAEVQHLIGFFLNTLALRFDLAGRSDFLTFLGRVREVTLESYAHQDLPFEALVEALEPQRSMSHSPLIQVMFVFNYPAELPELPGLKINPWTVEATTSKFDLTWSLGEASGALEGVVEYNRDLFEAGTIERMIGHFENLLAALIETPGSPLDEHPLLSSQERARLLALGKGRDSAAAEQQCLHHAFQAQSAAAPDALAAVYEQEQISFAELNRRANRLAHRLSGSGIGPESRVGICLRRSILMLQAVLGVLKAGAAYVPLNPAYPRQRLAFMLSDSGLGLLLSERGLLSQLPEAEAPIACLDEEAALEAEAHADPKSAVQPDNLCYVIYTSGSTGRPKGTALSHRALANLIVWHQKRQPIEAGTLQFASLSFDASFNEMVTAWCSGRAVHLVSESLRQDLDKLAEFVSSRPISKLILPVVVLQRWAESYSRNPHWFRGLQDVTTTGEQLNVTGSIIELFKCLPQCRLHNDYGPSETHVITAYSFNDDPDSWPAQPPIGKPLDNCWIRILDRNQQPVPLGVVSELHLGGVNLARGYLDRPRLTARQFVPDPFSDKAGSRLYKTGDLARCRADGNVEFLGRIDHQVKIRGFRVELGEIEAVLSRHPLLSHCVACVHGEGALEKRLTAYVVAEPGAEVSVAQLRDHLAKALPDFMIPSAFVFLDAIPLTAHGKVDRRALLPPEQPRRDEAQPYLAPDSPAQEVVAEIWQELLGIETVGVHDDFFLLGGHSLLAAQLISRVREAFQMDLPLRRVFDHPTVAQQVDALAEAVGSRSAVDEIAQIFQEVSQLSVQEAEAMLEAQRSPGKEKRLF